MKLENNLLIEPDLHDGNVTGIDWGDKSLTLRMQAVEGKQFTFRFAGVKAFLGTDFREGNCIYDIIIERKAVPQMDNIEVLCHKPNPAVSEYYQKKHRDYNQKIIDAVVAGELEIFSMHCSYGCDIRILYEKLEIESNDESEG